MSSTVSRRVLLGAAGAAALLPPSWIEGNVLPLLLDSARLTEMSQAARRLGHPTADEDLVDLVLGAVR